MDAGNSIQNREGNAYTLTGGFCIPENIIDMHFSISLMRKIE